MVADSVRAVHTGQLLMVIFEVWRDELHDDPLWQGHGVGGNVDNHSHHRLPTVPPPIAAKPSQTVQSPPEDRRRRSPSPCAGTGTVDRRVGLRLAIMVGAAAHGSTGRPDNP
jgi:hypothetical protein